MVESPQGLTLHRAEGALCVWLTHPDKLLALSFILLSMWDLNVNPKPRPPMQGGGAL